MYNIYDFVILLNLLFNKKILLDRIIEPVEVVSLVVNSCFL